VTELQEDESFLTWLEEQASEAESYTDDFARDEREQVLDFYLRRPMGDERPGRSQVVSGDVYKVVEGVSTAIADIYCSTGDAVEFVPRGEDDTEKAQQVTQAVMYTFWTTCQGYIPMIESIKSGVQFKHGYLMWYWEADKRLTRERYRNLDQGAIAMLQSNEAVRDLRIMQQTMGEEGPLFDVEVDVIRDQGRIVIESVPPEHVHVSSAAKSADVQKAPGIFVHHWKTEAECMRCGYTHEQIEAMDFSGASDYESNRNKDQSAGRSNQARIITAYTLVDRDGDGIVELHKSVYSPGVLLSDEIVDEINIAGWTPNIQPHEFIGRCPADDAVQVQKINSTLWRQGLDSLYHSTNPMWRVDKNATRVNIEDFYSPQLGQPVRADQGAAEPIALPYVGQHVFPMLEYSQADAENLTGWTRYAQGTDAESLNKTATGVRMITNMSQQRIRMMARNYGEMCFAPCLRGISKLLSQYGSKALNVRLSGRFVQVDPREWSDEFDMTVNVGLGTVDREQQQMQLGMVSQAQAGAVQAGGLGKVVTLKNIYNVQRKVAEMAGLKDPTFAWTDPDTVPPPEPPPPSPELQREQMRQEADAQKFQAQAELDREKRAADQSLAQWQAEFQAQVTLQLEQIKQDAETARAIQLEHIKALNQANSQSREFEERGKERTETEAVKTIVPAMADALNQVQEVAQQAVMASQALAGAKAERIEKVRDKAGKLIGARIYQADGQVREVQIQ
jgi:hypothetical protein